MTKKAKLLVLVVLSLVLAGCCQTGEPPAPSQIGRIAPPAGVRTDEDPCLYAGGVIRNGISLLILVAFIVALLWTIFAGFRFVTSGGDEKTVGQAWSSIYWGIVGLLVVVGSYAIVRLVEHFFDVNIITGPIVLPLP